VPPRALRGSRRRGLNGPNCATRAGSRRVSGKVPGLGHGLKAGLGLGLGLASGLALGLGLGLGLRLPLGLPAPRRRTGSGQRHHGGTAPHQACGRCQAAFQGW